MNDLVSSPRTRTPRDMTLCRPYGHTQRRGDRPSPRTSCVPPFLGGVRMHTPREGAREGEADDRQRSPGNRARPPAPAQLLISQHEPQQDETLTGLIDTVTAPQEKKRKPAKGEQRRTGRGGVRLGSTLMPEAAQQAKRRPAPRPQESRNGFSTKTPHGTPRSKPKERTVSVVDIQCSVHIHRKIKCSVHYARAHLRGQGPLLARLFPSGEGQPVMFNLGDRARDTVLRPPPFGRGRSPTRALV